METNALYLYTMAQKDGTLFRYIIDGSDIPGGKNFSELGTVENIGIWDKAAIKTFTTGKGYLGTIDRTENYGDTISAYEPIFNSSGKVIGLVACDINASEIVRWVRIQVIWQLAIVVLLVAVGLTVYLVVIKKVNQSFA
jgi:methyl-accepting chemotaxis protein